MGTDRLPYDSQVLQYLRIVEEAQREKDFGLNMEYNKQGFGGLLCEWCGEPILKTDLVASEDVGYCPWCGHFTSTERQTVRVRSLRDLLARPPETIRDEGTVDGVRRIVIEHSPIRRLLPSFFCWLFGVLAAEVALAYFFNVRSLSAAFAHTSSDSTWIAALGMLGIAFLFVFITLFLTLFRTRRWKLELGAETARIRCFLLGLIPWFASRRVNRRCLYNVHVVWTGGLNGRMRGEGLSPKIRPQNSQLFVVDEDSSRCVLVSEDLDTVLYMRAVLLEWGRLLTKDFRCAACGAELPRAMAVDSENGLVRCTKCGYEMRFAEAEFCRWSEQRVAADRPKGAKETAREITWRPSILSCPSGFILLICLWGGMRICQILKVDASIGLPALVLLLVLYFVLRKSCRYCLRLTDDELVFTRRFFCFRREVRVPRAGALAIGATWKKLPAVAVLLPDGTSRHLLSDLSAQTARWLIAWLNERLVCRWKRDRDYCHRHACDVES